MPEEQQTAFGAFFRLKKTLACRIAPSASPARVSARDPAREQAERGGEHLNPPAARAASSAWRRAARGAAPKCAQDKSASWLLSR